MQLRLTVNINDSCADSIQSYARSHHITVTEAVRRAISLLNFLDVECTLGHRMAIIDAKGKVIKIVKNEK